ncbi:hypothetical protein [Ensifer adhaerens]|uniref:hypothetical protein n=1 Tax=Ensifer adhaerens TaxID=106592 RepID=UPI000DC3D4EB|nr:hypothetical protein [Ensifer adhaerens]RAS04372.1 hypothetical protein DEU52_12648 [Ensifer adhaerens]
MSKMMVLGVKGEAGLWLVDFDAGTVVAIDGKREDYVASDNEVVMAEVAVAFETKEEAFSGFMYKTPPVDFAVAFQTEEEAFSDFMYKSPAISAADGKH